MKAIIKNVNEDLKIVELENTLEEFQDIVGGYIELVPSELINYSIAMICNEEGKLIGLEPNLDIGYDVVCGNIIFIGVDGEEFCGLNEKQIKLIQNIFKM